MEIQAVETAASTFSRAVAAEMRAEMARQRKTAADLATTLGITAHTAGRRLNGDIPFTVVELAVAASWLGMAVTTLLARAESVEATAS